MSITTRNTPSALPIGTLAAARRATTLAGMEITAHVLWGLVSEGRVRPGRTEDGRLAWSEADILHAISELELLHSR